MRRRTALLLTVFLVGLGAAQRPNTSGSARYAAVQHALVETSKPHAGVSKAVPYQVGTASWYGEYFEGKPTASGEPYNMYDLTAAHPTLPLGTYVKVTNLRNRRVVVVRINDRGPIIPGRIIDVSYSAARTLRFQSSGIQRVRLDVVPVRKVPATMAMMQRPALVP